MKKLALVGTASLVLLALACVPITVAAQSAAPAAVLARDTEVARRKVYPALVNISVVSRYFSGGRAQRQPGGGSGVIVTPQGHVLTNFHVAGNTTRVRCTLTTGETLEASVVTHDALTDLSVLKLRTSRKAAFPYARLANSDRLEVGERVLAMGNPLMLASSVTLGIVSNPKRVFLDFTGTRMDEMELAPGEKTGTLTRWIQHDALILGGNSGGPLVNLAGEVVGINELGGNGMGFAIPSNIAAGVLAQALKHGEVRRGWLGVTVMPVGKLGRRTGALVSGVAPGSPAEKCGVKPGDILLTIDNAPTNARFFEQVPLVYQRIAALQAGARATLGLWRSGKPVHATAVVAAMEKPIGEEDEFREMGFSAQEVTPPMALARRLPDANGLLLTGLRPGYPFEGAQPRLTEGDVIIAVDGAQTNTLAEMRKAVGGVARAGRKQIVLDCRRNRESLVAVVKVPDEQPDAMGTDLPRPWLGVRTQVLTTELATALKLEGRSGFRVTEVYPWTQASEAGLQVGDILTSLNGNALEASRAQDANDLRRAVEDLSVGEKAEFSVLRGGKDITVAVTLEGEPEAGEKAKRARQKEFEFAVRDVTMLDRMRNRWTRSQNGVIVADVTQGGWAHVAGLFPDDLVLEVDGKPVADVAAFERESARVVRTRPQVVSVFVRRGAQTQFVFIDPDWTKLAASK